MRRREEDYWREAIGKQATRGMSSAKFCRKLHMERGTFLRWRKRLGESARAANAFAKIRERLDRDDAILDVQNTGSMITSGLVVTYLLIAIWRRCPKSRVIVHSDQGSQFSSDARNRFYRDHNIERSMSRRGFCNDNAVVDSFSPRLNECAFAGRPTKP